MMPRMRFHGPWGELCPTDSRLAARRSAAFFIGLFLPPLLAGCADLHYDRLRLGQSPQEYDRILPVEQTRRTEQGLCYFARDSFGRQDAIVALLGADRRLAGKFQATRLERKYGWKTETGFLLRGELNPKALGYESLGPIDTARAVIDGLVSYQGEKLAAESRSWVAGGLARLLQHWPQAGEFQAVAAGLTETFEQIPAGGEASLRVAPQGFYQFEYRQGATR